MGDGETDGILMGHPYNKEWEVQRKENLLKLMLRTKAQERDDLSVQEQARKIEEAQRKSRKLDLKKKKLVDSEEAEPPLCPIGGLVVRSSMVSKRAEKAGALKWLATSGTPVTLSSQRTQQVFTALCNNIVELLDWQKQVARKKKEREAMYDKRQELARPYLKKRKAAPNQKFSDASAAGGAAPQGGAAAPAQAQQPNLPAPRSGGGVSRQPGSGQFAPSESGPAPNKKHRKH